MNYSWGMEWKGKGEEEGREGKGRDGRASTVVSGRARSQLVVEIDLWNVNCVLTEWL